MTVMNMRQVQQKPEKVESEIARDIVCTAVSKEECFCDTNGVNVIGGDFTLSS